MTSGSQRDCRVQGSGPRGHCVSSGFRFKDSGGGVPCWGLSRGSQKAQVVSCRSFPTDLFRETEKHVSHD